jgi:8-oxo-dGTP pyrophosphatase MutT (NUDIX family)
LVHDAKKDKNTGYGIPKGGRDGSESVKKTAIRELLEETGIKIKKKDLQTQYNVNVNKSKYIKIINYYVHEIKSLSEIGLEGLGIPKDKLQLAEIDDAKFMSLKDAKKLVNKDQLKILENLVKLNLLK